MHDPVQIYLNFLSCKIVFKTTMMIVPYEELTPVVTDSPQGKELADKASKK